MSAEVLTERPVEVIGGGIVGLADALELQARGHPTTIIDQNTTIRKTHETTSVAAAAQFLAVQRVDASPQTQTRIVNYTRVSRARYETLAQEDARYSGVMPIRNVELITKGSDNEWPQSLIAVMQASAHDLDKPIVVPGPDGGEQYYDGYYEFNTFSIYMAPLLHYLEYEFMANGGTFREEMITRDMLRRTTLPTIQAAGAGALLLASERGAELRWGFSENHAPDRKIPPVAISADDLIFMPRIGGGFAIGAPYLNKPNRTTPTFDETKRLRDRVITLTSTRVGSFKPIGIGAFMQPLTSYAGQRVVHPEGPIVGTSALNPLVIDNMAYGSMGCTLAFGGAPDVANLLEAAMQ
jgi:hypothetical protein